MTSRMDSLKITEDFRGLDYIKGLGVSFEEEPFHKLMRLAELSIYHLKSCSKHDENGEDLSQCKKSPVYAGT